MARRRYCVPFDGHAHRAHRLSLSGKPGGIEERGDTAMGPAFWAA